MNKQELIEYYIEGLEGDSFIEKCNEGYDKQRDCLISSETTRRTEKTCIARRGR